MLRLEEVADNVLKNQTNPCTSLDAAHSNLRLFSVQLQNSLDV